MSEIVTPPDADLMSPPSNVQRIMWTGTIWFAVAILSSATALGLLLSSGWRPAELSTGLSILWWIGSVLVVVSIGFIGWSGCPILEVDVPTANRNKTRTMQLGTLFFILGGAATMLAVLLGPAS
jgi:ABC-type transport system involved in multi-copper enzyme maturation permease subunit